MHLLVDPGFLSLALKFLWNIALRSPIGWTPLTDTTDKRTRDVPLCPSVRSFVRLLDGVWLWHYQSTVGGESILPLTTAHCCWMYHQCTIALMLRCARKLSAFISFKKQGVAARLHKKSDLETAVAWELYIYIRLVTPIATISNILIHEGWVSE